MTSRRQLTLRRPPPQTAPELINSELRTPRAAAVAGIIFSLLLMSSFWLIWRSVPADPQEAGAWLETNFRRVSLALNLVPFAGIAFFWFLGVLRDRLGGKEDKFFATVFLGSGLMFLAMIFVAASALAGIILAHAIVPDALRGSAAFAFARAFTFSIMHIYALKMAAVFMVTTSTLAIKTHLTARWIAFLGFACAALLLIGSSYLDWAVFVFPAWVLLVSGNILFENFRRD